MPTLPNLPEITDPAKWNRIYAAFDGDPAVYRAWLKAAIIDRVTRREQDIAAQQTAADAQTLL